MNIEELQKLLNEKEPFSLLASESKTVPYGNYDFSKPSLAVLAINSFGDGTILWFVGGHLAAQYDEVGSLMLSDNGLDGYDDGESKGIWIWEGRFHSSYDQWNGDYDAWLEGDIRPPTPTEWLSIHKNECPWNDEDWKLK